jgi:hypothetical protein
LLTKDPIGINVIEAILSRHSMRASLYPDLKVIGEEL